MKTTSAKIVYCCGLSLLCGWPQARIVSGIAAFNHLNPATQAGLPGRLSGTGLYDDVASPNRRVTSGILPYEVNSPVWKDYTFKERFVQLPPGTSIQPAADAANRYQFPDSTIFVQNFYLDTIRGNPASRILLETRFLIIRSQYNPGTGASDTGAFGVSYWWLRDQSDALLVNPATGALDTINVKVDSVVRGMYWSVPRSGECRYCHVNRKALGFITPQLNRDINGINQLDDLVAKGILSTNPVAGISGSFRWAGLDDTGATLELKARSYIGANCSHCHGNGVSNTQHTFEFLSAQENPVYDPNDFSSTGYVGRPAPGFQYNMFINPGHPDSSFILFRMLSRGTPSAPTNDQMPLYETYLVDSAGIWAVANWACDLGGVPLNQCILPNESSPPMPEGIRGIHGRKSGQARAVISNGHLILSRNNHEPVVLRDITGKSIRLTRVTESHYLLPENAPTGLYFLSVGTKVWRVGYLR